MYTIVEITGGTLQMLHTKLSVYEKKIVELLLHETKGLYLDYVYPVKPTTQNFYTYYLRDCGTFV